MSPLSTLPYQHTFADDRDDHEQEEDADAEEEDADADEDEDNEQVREDIECSSDGNDADENDYTMSEDALSSDSDHEHRGDRSADRQPRRSTSRWIIPRRLPRWRSGCSAKRALSQEPRIDSKCPTSSFWCRFSSATRR